MTIASTPLVSVATPVYNGEQYLRECIESVLAQTYTNWDYTIVDNCSTDRTLEIAREYAARDSRIRIHCNQAFVPVIGNYNNAFRQISPQSKYCKIVAADDWLFPECLERMVRLGEDYPDVAIIAAHQLRGTGVAAEGLPHPKTRVAGREICRMQLMGGPYVFGTPTTVLFRSSIVRSRHAFFNESNLHADDEACVEFLEHHAFGFVPQILTFRRVQEGSLTSFSERFNTYAPGLLLLLVKYGPKYLSDEELKTRIREVRRHYYRCLGKDVLRGRDREFWRYHRTKLAELGYPLSPLRLTAGVVTVLLDLVLNPKSTFEKAVQWKHATNGRTNGARPALRPATSEGNQPR